jgi:hypothetical protein
MPDDFRANSDRSTPFITALYQRAPLTSTGAEAMNTSFKGAKRDIDDIDLPTIAATIGAGEDELHAFMDVEAAGSPWDKQGRPKMLFEPHLFYRALGPGKKRDAAVKAGLAYAKWGAKKYPADSYPRLLQAMAIDEAKALMPARRRWCRRSWTTPRRISPAP